MCVSVRNAVVKHASKNKWANHDTSKAIVKEAIINKSTVIVTKNLTNIDARIKTYKRIVKAII